MGLLDELRRTQKPKRNLMGTQMVKGPDQPYLRQDYPTVYGALGGLLGTAPDQFEGSIMDPNTAAVRQGAEYGFPVGTALAMLPAAAPVSRGAAATARFVAPKAGQLAEGYMQRMGMMPGIIERSNPNTVWYRGQTGAKSAENPFDSTIRGTPSLADSPAVASEYAINPNAAGNYGLLGAGEDVSGAVVQPYTTSGKVFNINEYQGGFGTETGITQENLKKIAKELGVDPSKLTDELMENFSQKWGKGKNAYWDTTERGSKSKNKIIPAWVVVENQTLIDAAKKKGIDSIQFKGALSDANAYDSLLPWNEKITHQELRPLNREAISSTFESPRTNNLAPQQAALDLAQQRAALPVSQGGLGLPAGNTAEQRAAAMGFDTPAYHGTTTDIKPTFNLDYSGSNAFDYGQKNIFASSDPQLASDYALKGLSRNQAEAIKQKNNYDWYKSKVIPKDMMDAFVKDAVEYGVAEGGGANVLPLLMRGNIFPYEAYGGRFSSEIPKALLGRDLSNADIAAINNVVDNPTLKKVNPSTVYAIKNPENIRSRFAAFDPFRRSAAIAATMGVAAPDLLASPIDEEELRRLQSGLLYAP